MADQFPASRSTGFGYVCRRCSRCCQHKRIQLNPYEVARLARARNQSTTEFRRASTVDGQGTALAQKDDGTCVFLGPQGCEVHADRPLVCRLYPLGRHVRADGFEYFTRHEGHPLSEGEFTDRGTIDGFLEAQGAKLFMAAQDRYFQFLCWAHEQIAAAQETTDTNPVDDAVGVDLLDIDLMIAEHCADTGENEPVDIEDRLRLHLNLLYDLIANKEGQHVAEKSQDRSNKVPQ